MKINVLNDQGFVELIETLGTDQNVINAARVSYDGDVKERTEEQDRKLIRYLLKNKHTSPFEHVIFTFHVKCPIFIARQWMRHRMWSYNEISARYTEVDFDVYTPNQWRMQSTTNKQMSAGVFDENKNVEMSEAYELAVRKSMETYSQLLQEGVSREMSRAVLPQGMFTRFYATVDLHNLLHFIALRNHEHAQNEIREYAAAMLTMVKTAAPVTYEEYEKLYASK